MAARFNNCISIGTVNREKTANEFCDLFGGKITAQQDNWTEVSAGPFRFYFVEDGTKDIAFSVDVDDEQETLSSMKMLGYRVDKEISQRVGETFVRNPDEILINLYPAK